ncbi:hypothetical protein [Saccharophagus degradans]|uniref:MAE-28990/MAE-18760-like HEPN domain-containing protein n=1 Tax=Saccharophagus degradans TaxID=86304 RepID=A0AAW7X6C4_9GAMM|nr:hypothetical protein [Saccharophagus degradans]MDO6422296.1 hypothetical protein [Saccharophagus degradans]MDO6607429.1 hypothetical protein [Saccharophagus degradans]
MKQIELPTVNTVSFKLNPSNIEFEGIVMPDGRQHISLGNIDKEKWDNLTIARENGGKILWATICMEHLMEDIILSFFMGSFDGPNEKRELFRNELLKGSFLQLSSKKHLISKISNQYYAFKGKDRDKLQNCLKSIIQWRNAFAHGSFNLNATEGVILEYYSGAPKTEDLNDSFWNTVEAIYKKCDSLLKNLENIVKKESPRKR